jgi:hypothetical protein
MLPRVSRAAACPSSPYFAGRVERRIALRSVADPKMQPEVVLCSPRWQTADCQGQNEKIWKTCVGKYRAPLWATRTFKGRIDMTIATFGTVALIGATLGFRFTVLILVRNRYEPPTSPSPGSPAIQPGMS